MKKEVISKETKRLKALKSLIIWLIVIVISVGILTYVSSISKKDNSKIVDKVNTSKEVKKDVLSYFDKLRKLISDDYEFNYLITKNKEKIKFDGFKKNGIVEGYKQDNNQIIKYKIKAQKTYKILIDQEVEITNLYEDIDSSLLDLNYLVATLMQISDNDVIITEEETITTYDYNLTKDEEEIEIKVVENDNFIEEISIKRSNETYELKYKEK